MAWWIVFLVVLGGVLLVALLVVLLSKVTERVSAASRGVSTGGGDTAPGWILRCTRCQSWRPATEAGVVRLGAASRGKRTLGRCSACGRISWIAVEKGPGEHGKRRIDSRTNHDIDPGV